MAPSRANLDLLLVPWEERASSAAVPGIVKHIASICGLRITGEPSDKPHGRKAYTLHLGTPEAPDVRWVGLSVMPCAAPPPAA